MDEGRYGRRCHFRNKCDRCEGHCERDSDCEGRLKCMRRVGENVPACMTSNVPETFNVCYKPLTIKETHLLFCENNPAANCLDISELEKIRHFCDINQNSWCESASQYLGPSLPVIVDGIVYTSFDIHYRTYFPGIASSIVFEPLRWCTWFAGV